MILHYTGAEPGMGARALVAQLKKALQDAETSLESLETLRVQSETLAAGELATASLVKDSVGWLLKLGIPMGAQGEKGTPERGTDYWTESDKQEIIKDVLAELPLYTGTTTVEPDWSAQTLETSEKVMTDNVTINSIHTWEVSNDSDGVTCIIGPEV